MFSFTLGKTFTFVNYRWVMTLSRWLRSLAMGHLHVEDSRRLQKNKFKNVPSRWWAIELNLPLMTINLV